MHVKFLYLRNFMSIVCICIHLEFLCTLKLVPAICTAFRCLLRQSSLSAYRKDPLEAKLYILWPKNSANILNAFENDSWNTGARMCNSVSKAFNFDVCSCTLAVYSSQNCMVRIELVLIIRGYKNMTSRFSRRAINWFARGVLAVLKADKKVSANPIYPSLWRNPVSPLP